jgi:Ca2+-binding EF-hand superfamily protein
MKTLSLLIVILSAFGLAALAADEKPAAPAKPKRDPAQLFKNFDRDNDGSITLEEYKAGMVGHMDPARIDGVFKFKDKDSDGKLNLDELMTIPPKATPKPAPKTEAKPEKKPEKKP